MYYLCIVKQLKGAAHLKRHIFMKSERKQLAIFENQICKAIDIVLQQKSRYESLQSELCNYSWTCEDDGQNNAVALGLLESLGALEQIYENLYI